MQPRTARLLSIIFIALSLAPALAHLLELPAKIRMPRDEYLAVQQIYRGWALLGILIFAAIAATLAAVVLNRPHPRAFRLSLTGLVLLLGAQAVFWVFTFPANQVTRDWTVLPPDWMAWRDRWEYSHAAGAALMLGAFLSATLSAFVEDRPGSRARSAGREAA